IAYDPTKKLVIGPFEISFLKTVHPVPCFGMRITDGDKTIIYTADTSYQKEWIDFSKNAQLLIADTNLYDEQKNLNIRHMTSTEDTSIERDANIYFSKNAQLLIADTNLYDEQKNLNIGHMTSTEAASIARDANIETLIMSHLPQYGNNDDLITEAQKIYEGEVLLA